MPRMPPYQVETRVATNSGSVRPLPAARKPRTDRSPERAEKPKPNNPRRKRPTIVQSSGASVTMRAYSTIKPFRAAIIALPRSDMAFLLEIVATDAAEIHAARDGGADRLELCAAIEVGGLTPSPGLVEMARKELPIVAMLRPHARSFVYSPEDRTVILRDLGWLSETEVSGIVFGALTPEGKVDIELLAEVVGRGKPVVFHRAFDAARDRDEALEDVIAAGVVRILTSGGGASALDGLPALRRSQERAKGRVEILPGGGIRPSNAARLLKELPTGAIHAAPFRGVLPEPSIVRAFRAGEGMSDA
ncbi:copper homeostasis protein CutC [bacterium]|nr:MAG: copper homeostasis protein CutC [bacterium]